MHTCNTNLWKVDGTQTSEQEDGSRYNSAPPHCCLKTPIVVDLLLGTPQDPSSLSHKLKLAQEVVD